MHMNCCTQAPAGEPRDIRTFARWQSNVKCTKMGASSSNSAEKSIAIVCLRAGGENIGSGVFHRAVCPVVGVR